MQVSPEGDKKKSQLDDPRKMVQWHGRVRWTLLVAGFARSSWTMDHNLRIGGASWSSKCSLPRTVVRAFLMWITDLLCYGDGRGEAGRFVLT